MDRFLKVLQHKYSVGILVVLFSIGVSIFLSIVFNQHAGQIFKVLFGIAGALFLLGLIIAFVYSEVIGE